jgi:hypothetical protein
VKAKFFAARDLVGGFWRSGENAQGWEDKVNAWLAANPQARIVFMKQTSAGFITSQWFISLWYEEESA